MSLNYGDKLSANQNAIQEALKKNIKILADNDLSVGFLKKAEKLNLGKGLPYEELLECVEVIKPKKDLASKEEDQDFKVSPAKAFKAQIVA